MSKINFKLEAAKIIDPFTEEIYVNYCDAAECALIMVRKLKQCTMPCSEFGGEITEQTQEYWEKIEEEMLKL